MAKDIWNGDHYICGNCMGVVGSVGCCRASWRKKNQTCPQVVGHLCNEHGEPAWEVTCGEPCEFKVDGIAICAGCATKFAASGDFDAEEIVRL